MPALWNDLGALDPNWTLAGLVPNLIYAEPRPITVRKWYHIRLIWQYHDASCMESMLAGKHMSHAWHVQDFDGDKILEMLGFFGPQCAPNTWTPWTFMPQHLEETMYRNMLPNVQYCPLPPKSNKKQNQHPIEIRTEQLYCRLLKQSFYIPPRLPEHMSIITQSRNVSQPGPSRRCMPGSLAASTAFLPKGMSPARFSSHRYGWFQLPSCL